MIEVTDYQGRVHFVAPDAVAMLTQAAPSSQWHGIRCIVKLFDGTIIESGDTAELLKKRLDDASPKKGGAA